MARVILLDQYAGLGGGQRILMDLAHAFRRAGHGVRVMVPGEGTAARRLEEDGFPVLPLPLPDMTPGRKTLREKVLYPLAARRAAREIGRALGSEPADLLYANAPRTFLPAVLASRRGGPPVACALHLLFTRGLEYRLIRWCFRRKEVRRVLFCSSAVARPFASLCGGKGVRLHYWVSPRFLEAPPERERARRAWELGPEDVAVGVLGRISRTKGQALFLEALAPLLKDHPRLRLLVGGGTDFEDPEEERRVQALARSSPDPSRVAVAGRMVEALSFLDALDVLVVPSLWEEPFGLVAVEGMARRLPVVVTRSGGLVEIVEEGVTGFHAEKDPLSLRRAVEPLLGDRSLRHRLGAAGRRRAERDFNPEIQMGALLSLCFAKPGEGGEAGR
jgi:glycosyltransferase involved in cell wall biosynthesis